MKTPFESTFICSDHHFGHTSIIEYANRPFSGSEEMTKALINNHNETVKGTNNPLTIFLGDVFFRKCNKEVATKILSRMRGRKALIMGNHDNRSTQWYKDVGFTFVYEHSICINGNLWLSHRPMEILENSKYLNLHGHTHGRECGNARNIDLCVEVTDYRPVKLSHFVNYIL